jgi:DNA polymerase I-like protein with 3'-5' exonuclease and polymerase domains
MVYEISQQKLNIELTELNKNMHETKTRSFAKKIHNNNWKIDYNIFGTITGRLSTKKNSFPILTMSKDYRKIVKPKNDWFIELDFNAAELRCLLSLNEKQQPEQDIHEWHQKIINNLSDQEMTRDDIKRKIFSWLYGPLSVSLGIPQIEKYYDKQYCLNKYWNRQSEIVTNPFGRKIKADEFHALNALIQSTTSDMFLRRAIAVNKILQSKKSFTMALIHDSMVIDFAKEDKNILEEIIDVFGDTEFGKFKSNVSLGTHFGNMRKFR